MSREEPEERASGRDAVTRDRIVRGAAEVVFRLGVAEMSVERVRAASGASRSQVTGPIRAKLEDAFQTWQSYLAAGLRWMQDRGELNAEADVAELATGVVAALQGGLILAQADWSEKPLRAALDLAVGRVALAADRHARRSCAQRWTKWSKATGARLPSMRDHTDRLQRGR